MLEDFLNMPWARTRLIFENPPSARISFALYNQANMVDNGQEHRGGDQPFYSVLEVTGSPVLQYAQVQAFNRSGFSGQQKASSSLTRGEVCSGHSRNWSLCATKKNVLFFSFCFHSQRTGNNTLTNTKSQNASASSRQQTHIWAKSLKRSGLRPNYMSIQVKY